MDPLVTYFPKKIVKNDLQIFSDFWFFSATGLHPPDPFGGGPGI